MKRKRHLLFRMTQLIRGTMQEVIMQKGKQFSVEIIINEDTMAEELTNANKNCHCVTQDRRQIVEVIQSINPGVSHYFFSEPDNRFF